MYWGNGNAGAQSNPAAVFDSAAGSAGVWHLGDEGDSIHDATGGCFNGMNSGATAAEGMIGNSMSFANGNFIKIPGLLRSPTTVTLSAWVKSDKTAGQDVISLGDAALIRFDDVNLTTAGCFHQTLYIDGMPVTVTHYVNPINYAGLGTDTYIGMHGNGKTSFNFVGQIDEVRVNSKALTPDWMKLCFMNQKAQDALIRW
jgi:hypothetical protein